MSLEDLNFESDESDVDEVDSDTEDEEACYWELFFLHDNLRRFDNIYLINRLMDMQVGTEDSQ